MAVANQNIHVLVMAKAASVHHDTIAITPLLPSVAVANQDILVLAMAVSNQNIRVLVMDKSCGTSKRCSVSFVYAPSRNRFS
jgi:hypothetical protein